MKTYDTMEKKTLALLVIIVHCFIDPSTTGCSANAMYIPFLKNIKEVDSYAWGAALLAALYSGMKNFNFIEDKKTMSGNPWVLLGFFVLRIPRLCEICKIKVRKELPYMTSVLDACQPIWNDRKGTKIPKVKKFLKHITDKDICWRPYSIENLREEIKHQLQYVKIVTPLFCMNHLANHAPDLVPKQFPDAEFLVKSTSLLKIKERSKRGNNNVLFIERHYKKHVKKWNNVQPEQPSDHPAPPNVTSEQSDSSRHTRDRDNVPSDTLQQAESFDHTMDAGLCENNNFEVHQSASSLHWSMNTIQPQVQTATNHTYKDEEEEAATLVLCTRRQMGGISPHLKGKTLPPRSRKRTELYQVVRMEEIYHVRKTTKTSDKSSDC